MTKYYTQQAASWTRDRDWTEIATTTDCPAPRCRDDRYLKILKTLVWGGWHTPAPDKCTPNLNTIHPSPRIGGRSGRDDGSLRRPRAGSFWLSTCTYMGTLFF